MATNVPSKDPDAVEPYFFVWCSEDGTNDGGSTDDGELQGATISSYTLTVPSGITKDSDNKNAVTIQGTSYDANTVVAVWLSGGTEDNSYDLTCRIVTSDSRTLDKTITIPVRSH
jgi:hypothetical protein